MDPVLEEMRERNTKELLPSYDGHLPQGVHLKRCSSCKRVRPDPDYHTDNTHSDGDVLIVALVKK